MYYFFWAKNQFEAFAVLLSPVRVITTYALQQTTGKAAPPQHHLHGTAVLMGFCFLAIATFHLMLSHSLHQPAAATAHSSDFYFTFSISRSEQNGSRSSRTEQNRFRVCYSQWNCAPKPTYYSRFGCTLDGLFLLRPPTTITTAMECK